VHFHRGCYLSFLPPFFFLSFLSSLGRLVCGLTLTARFDSVSIFILLGSGTSGLILPLLLILCCMHLFGAFFVMFCLDRFVVCAIACFLSSGRSEIGVLDMLFAFVWCLSRESVLGDRDGILLLLLQQQTTDFFFFLELSWEINRNDPYQEQGNGPCGVLLSFCILRILD